jgi:DNA gyrase subunit A
MGRPAFGNRGISLKKGDYVIGAAVTPSNDARNKARLARAAAAGLTAQVEKTLDEAGMSLPTSDLSSRPQRSGAERPASSGSPRISDVAARTSAPDGQELLGSDVELSPEAAAKLQKLDEKLGLTPCLILTVSENGYGKRTDVDAYRLQSRGGKGVINMKATAKVGKVVTIQLVDDTTEMMVISQFGKIIRIDTKSVRAAGRSTSGVRLLNLEQADGTMGSVADKVASATVIPPEDPKTNGENGALVQ